MFDLLNIHLFHDASNLVSIELVSDKNNVLESLLNNNMVESTIPNLHVQLLSVLEVDFVLVRYFF